MELWGFPLTAPRVKYVSNYSFPLAELNRTLTPIAGYDAGVYNFTTIGISNNEFKYHGGVLGPDGKIVFVPSNADNIGILELGNQDLAYEVSGGIPEAWSSLLSPHFNNF